MSMTREEAIKELETIKMCEMDTVRQVHALDVALSALCTVSRERVKRLTDEAVEMVMERLEKLKNEIG